MNYMPSIARIIAAACLSLTAATVFADEVADVQKLLAAGKSEKPCKG